LYSVPISKNSEDPDRPNPLPHSQSTQANWHIPQTETVDFPTHHKCPHVQDFVTNDRIPSTTRSTQTENLNSYVQTEVSDRATVWTTVNRRDKIRHRPQIEKPDSATPFKKMNRGNPTHTHQRENPDESKTPTNLISTERYEVLIRTLLIVFNSSRNKNSDASELLIGLNLS
jgi:hypothetical protein